ncbi:hypothetical protein MIMGU_mgv1a026327mg, partial [Erythranthe guttata]
VYCGNKRCFTRTFFDKNRILLLIFRVWSKEFDVGDYKWRLIIYPYGKEKDHSHVSVYLAMAETSSLPIDWEFNANFTIFLYNQISMFSIKRRAAL